MGDLIGIDEFGPHYEWGGHKAVPGTQKRDPTWYFEQFEYEGNYRYKPKIESSFPEQVAIHWDHLSPRHSSDEYSGEHIARKVAIRRYVRDQLVGDVILTSVEKNYAFIGRYKSERDAWRHDGGMKPYRTKVRHGYYIFHFETAADAVKFGLAFGSLISDIDERHPRDYRDVTEEQIKEARDNPFGVYGEN